jgi:AraC-like DNA-binding protein
MILTGNTALEAGDVCEELDRLYNLEQPAMAAMMRRQSQGYRLAELVVSASSMEPKTQRLLPYLERLSPVLAYIHENLAQPLTREELAAVLHLSPSRFYVLFKEALGVSPTEYLQALRIQHAQRLLLNSDLSVSEIGAGSGYPDEFHFSRLFRRRCGISPLQYRKSILKNLHG